jgi:hypothetical protein
MSAEYCQRGKLNGGYHMMDMIYNEKHNACSTPINFNYTKDIMQKCCKPELAKTIPYMNWDECWAWCAIGPIDVQKNYYEREAEFASCFNASVEQNTDDKATCGLQCIIKTKEFNQTGPNASNGRAINATPSTFSLIMAIIFLLGLSF